MQKIKFFYAQSKIQNNRFNSYLNENWLPIFLLVTCLFFVKLINHIIVYIKTENYSHMHNEIFIMSLLCFITIYFMRPLVLWFLIPFLITRIIDFDYIFHTVQNYFFNKSIFAHMFESLGSKDINVIIISFFTIYMLVIGLFLIGYRIINKKWHLKSIFLFITLVVYVLTTGLFHYFLVEKNYRHIINNEISHMDKVAHASEKDFKIICSNQQYVCATSNEEIKSFINNKEFNHYIENIPEHYKMKGNFSFGGTNNIYLVIKNRNQWVINPDLAKTACHDTGNYLMLSLDIAHSFWLFFFIWLNVFHCRLRIKKEIV